MRSSARSSVGWYFPGILCLCVLSCGTAGAANPCWNGSDGIGGTGSPRDAPGNAPTAPGSDGIGGTGNAPEAEPPSAQPSAGGDGLGGTGIVGTITGFGSICVSGVEVHYDLRTPVTVNGEPAPASGLAIGHVVAVEIAGSGTPVRAQRIAVLNEVIGIVTQVDPKGGELRVLDQRVVLTGGTRFFVGLEREALKPGSLVRVSGLRGPTGEVVATFVELAPASAPALVRGTLIAAADGTVTVAGMPVSVPPGLIMPATGSVIASGNWTGRELRVEHLLPDPVWTLLERVARIELQGLVQSATGGAVRVGGLTIHAGPHTRLANTPREGPEAGADVIVSGTVRPDRSIDAVSISVRTQRPPGAPADRSRDGTAAADTGPASPGRAADKIESTRRSSEGESDDREKATGTVQPQPSSGWSEQPPPGNWGGLDKSGPVDKPVKVEPPQKPDRVERPDRPDKVERPEKPDRPERSADR